jgi:hypothetical protein
VHTARAHAGRVPADLIENHADPVDLVGLDADGPGTDVVILKIVLPKNWRKYCVFDLQNCYVI